MFSLARALLSPGSAEDLSSLFAWLIDTRRGPTPPERARPPCGFGPSRTGLLPLRAEALQRSPGSRAGCFSACAGSPTTQDRLLARDIANSRVAFLLSGESRRPGFAFFEAP